MRTAPNGSKRKAFDFGFFQVRDEPGYGWIMDRPPAVVIVPLAPGGERVWLARIERVPTRSRSWECPGGEIDGAERPRQAGLRELEEECGLVATAGAKVLRSSLEMAPGMGRFPHRIVVAEGVVPANGRRPVPQRDEGIVAVRDFALGEVHRLIEKGAISVHATLAALTACGWLLGRTGAGVTSKQSASSKAKMRARPASRR